MRGSAGSSRARPCGEERVGIPGLQTVHGVVLVNGGVAVEIFSRGQVAGRIVTVRLALAHGQRAAGAPSELVVSERGDLAVGVGLRDALAECLGNCRSACSNNLNRREVGPFPLVCKNQPHYMIRDQNFSSSSSSAAEPFVRHLEIDIGVQCGPA